jgi:hypothetical protein
MNKNENGKSVYINNGYQPSHSIEKGYQPSQGVNSGYKPASAGGETAPSNPPTSGSGEVAKK